MKDAAESLPSDLAAAHAMIIAERHARLTAEANAAVAKAEAANAQADLTSSEALIAHLELSIDRMLRALDGTRSEWTARLLDGASARRSGGGSDRVRTGGRKS